MKNENYWENLLLSVEVDDNTKEILKGFFIPDSIDFDKFIINQKAFENNGYYFEGITSGIKATPSIEFASKPYNHGASIHDWFIVAYPDIIFWMSTDRKYVDDAIIFSNLKVPTPDFKFYRYLINKYLSQGHRLECAL